MSRPKSPAHWLTTLVVLSLASIASAHPGGAMHNMAEGVIHPITGLDHLLVMVAVGVWAALGSGRRVWTVPAAFVGSLVLGLVIGLLGGSTPITELMIAASVVAVGLLIAGRIAMSSAGAIVAAAIFGLFHGLSHGAAIPAGTSASSFAIGMVASTAVLHLAGVLIGKRLRRVDAIRFAGAAVACCGLLLALGVM